MRAARPQGFWHEDEYLPSGGEDVYEPFWFRTFRFIRIEAETADEPLTISVPSFSETGYPLEAVSRMESPESWVGALWDISVRTLRRCMHETYEDCPNWTGMTASLGRLAWLRTLVTGNRSIGWTNGTISPGALRREPWVLPPRTTSCMPWPCALALYEFTRGLLGVCPASPGWAEILIAPRPLSLPSASGQVVTPRGVVSVEWKNPASGFAIRADAPRGVPVTLVLPDGETMKFPEGGEIQIGDFLFSVLLLKRRSGHYGGLHGMLHYPNLSKCNEISI